MILRYLKFTDEYKQLTSSDSKNSPQIIATLGAMTYIAHAAYQTSWLEKSHILIGNYTQIAHGVIFEIGYNHAFRGVTAYPFDQVLGYRDVFANRSPFNRQQLIIGSDVWIGSGVRIIKAIKIGNGAIIGSGAVVTKDVPPFAIVGGNPATLIRYRFSPENIAKLQAIKWWNWPLAKVKEALPLFDAPEKFIEQFYHQDLLHFPDEPFGEKIASYKENGYTIFYFIPDLHQPAETAVWPDVLRQFAERYTKADKVLLLLGLNQTPDDAPEKIAPLQRLLAQFPAMPPLTFLVTSTGLSRPLLKYADYFITTKDAITSLAIDYMDSFGGKILCGLEYDIFSYAECERDGGSYALFSSPKA